MADRPYPRIGLALGGGGARGLAHIAILEAFDETGVRPAAIAGTSIGALIGAAYAAGYSAREIRTHAEGALANRIEAARRFLGDSRVKMLDLINLRPFSGALFEGQALARLALPEIMPETFEELAIPLTLMATDFYGRKEVALKSGPLIPAVAASMALPGLVSPQTIDGCLLIDGGVTNPLPFDHLETVDITVAVDVTGRPVRESDEPPSGTELWFRSAMIMEHLIVQAKIERHAPDMLIVPDVDEFRVLEFLKIREILAGSAPAKAELKRALEKLLQSQTA